MKSFTTPKGTELPLLNLKGKNYLQIAHRLVWLNEEVENFDIQSEFVRLEEDFATAKTTVTIFGTNANGQSIVIKKASAYKTEHAKHFPDFAEKSSTGALGRALAMLGFGTQFCSEELDEGERIVDAPIEPAKKKASSFKKSDPSKDEDF